MSKGVPKKAVLSLCLKDSAQVHQADGDGEKYKKRDQSVQRWGGMK